MSVVEFKKKRQWDANNVLDCLEIVKESIIKHGNPPDSVLIIPCWDNHVQFHIGGKEMSSAEVIGIIELVKNDIALGVGSDDE